jgi:hypothetical protein
MYPIAINSTPVTEKDHYGTQPVSRPAGLLFNSGKFDAIYYAGHPTNPECKTS